MNFNYKVLQFSIEPEQLEHELNRIAGGWSLIQLIPVTKIEPQIMLNGQPKMKMLFIGIFTQLNDEYENKD
jgi:hypothetical protein